MQRVGAQLEEAAELARRRRRPEGEFLHQRGVLGVDKGLEGFVERGEFGMRGDVVEGGVVAVVALVFPDVDWWWSD